MLGFSGARRAFIGCRSQRFHFTCDFSQDDLLFVLTFSGLVVVRTLFQRLEWAALGRRAPLPTAGDIFRSWLNLENDHFFCLYCAQTSNGFKIFPRKQSTEWILSAPELFWRSRYILDCSHGTISPLFWNILIAACWGLLKSSSHLLKYFEIFQNILIAGCRGLAGPVLKDRGGPGSVASNRSSEMP